MANIDNPYLNSLSYLSTLFNPHNPYILHLQNVFNNLKQQQQQQQQQDGVGGTLDPAAIMHNLANLGVNQEGVKVNQHQQQQHEQEQLSPRDVGDQAESKSSEYVSKMKSARHHHHHHHHHHHKSSSHRRTKINKNDLKLPTNNVPSSTSPSLSSVSSASSSPLSSSSSSSLISSEPGSPVLLSPQPHHQHHQSKSQQQQQQQQQQQYMMSSSKHLQQSYSVPKLATTGDVKAASTTSPYYHTAGGEHFFAPGSKGSQPSSNEVKQKLKNLILQKLNRDGKLNQSTSNLPAPKAVAAVPVKGPFKAESKSSVPVVAAVTAADVKPIAAVEMDENLLRRTTSEPNLKVKSALKDRLLEKRNMVNPFLAPNVSMAKRAAVNSMVHQQFSFSPQPVGMQPVSMQPPAPPPLSTSLGSLHSPYQDQNSIFAAAAAAAAAAVAAITNQQQSDQKQQQSAAIAAAAASLLSLSSGQQQQQQQQQTNNQQQQQLTSLLQELAFQQQLVKHLPPGATSFDHNVMADHKLSASVSFPTLPRPQQHAQQVLQPAGYSQYGAVGRHHHHHQQHPHHAMLHPVTTKFGHIADVEEENELLLENELKCAAKLNDAASKNMYDEETHSNNNHHQPWHKCHQENEAPRPQHEEDNDDEGMLVESSQPSLPSSHNINLPQHHPYHPKQQQQTQLKFNKFNRLNRLERANSSQYYAPPHHASLSKTPTESSSSSSSAAALNNIELIQRQLAHLQQQQHQDREEELKRQQRFAASSSVNRTSYFSDPYLLKSFEIASISSNGHLNGRDINNNNNNNNNQENTNTNKFGNYFKRGEERLLAKSNQVSCSTNTKNVLQTFISNKHHTTKVDGDQVQERVYRYTTALVYDPAMLKHECTCLNASNHLETSDRIESIWNRFKSVGLDQECELVQSKQASIDDLLTCHSEQYALIYGSDIETRARLPKEYLQMYMMNMCIAPCSGIALAQDQDNSWNEEHTPVACRTAVGSTYELASLVYNGKLKNGFALVRPPGSHAEYSRPFGFCYFNTVACVAKMLKKNLSLERILIVDWDVHHGNGTQQLTYNDGNILYISLHRHDGGNFFPGTGSIHECGQEAGVGKNVNIAWNSKLNPAMSDAEYLAAFRSVVMPIAKAFDPQIVLVSSGFDATEQHPKELGGYKISPMCFAYMTKKLMSLADGKVVLVLEGGYDLQSLCDCSELCLHALMNKQTPSFSDATLDAQPNSSAIADLENVIQIQKKHWPMLNDYKQYIRMSQNQFISVYTE